MDVHKIMSMIEPVLQELQPASIRPVEHLDGDMQIMASLLVEMQDGTTFQIRVIEHP